MNEEMMKVFSLEGQVAVVTGGGSGLGFGTAKCLRAAGAKLVLLGRREEVLQKACEELGGDSVYYTYDVTKTEGAKDMIAKIEADTGGIDILVNNAGNHYKKFAEELPVAEFENIIATHLTGAFALTQAALPYMRKRHAGSVIFIGSANNYFGVPHNSAYSSAKNALFGLMRVLAVEYSRDGIRFNAVAPGFMDTAMMHKAVDADKERGERIIAKTPMRQFGNPVDVGWAIVYLCSAAASFVNSTDLRVDGGIANGF